MFKMFKILICFLKKILVGFGLNFLDFVKCKRKRKRKEGTIYLAICDVSMSL